MKKIKLLKTLIFVFIFAVGFSIGFLATKRLPQKTKLTPLPTPSSPPEEVINPNIQVSENEKVAKVITPDSTGSVNILFLGMGGAGHDGGGLTDSLTLANINYQKKVINLIALPRDLWYAGQKINAVYSTGGAKTLKFNVGQITGLQTDYFINVDFGNFASGIDTLGGIDVDNPKTWDDYFYPVKGKEQELCGFSAEFNAEVNQKYKGFELEKQFTCRYEHLHFEKGSINLDGETALKYIRSRHSTEYGSDFARGERAQAVLVAIGKKLIEKNPVDTGSAVFKKLVSSVASDITLAKIPEILKTVGDISAYKIIHTYLTDQNVLVGGTGPGGAYILVPKAGTGNFEEVRNLISP